MNDGISEGQYLASLHDGTETTTLAEKVFTMRERYNTAKIAKKGQVVKCGCCGNDFKKIASQQAFCSGHCKDSYWNTVDQTRFQRARCFSFQRFARA